MRQVDRGVRLVSCKTAFRHRRDPQIHICPLCTWALLAQSRKRLGSLSTCFATSFCKCMHVQIFLSWYTTVNTILIYACIHMYVYTHPCWRFLSGYNHLSRKAPCFFGSARCRGCSPRSCRTCATAWLLPHSLGGQLCRISVNWGSLQCERVSLCVYAWKQKHEHIYICVFICIHLYICTSTWYLFSPTIIGSDPLISGYSQ